MRDDGGTGDMHIIGDFDVSDDSGLPGYRAAFPDPGTAGNTHTGSNCRVLTDDDIMGYLDQVIELDATLDKRVTQRTSINGGIGTDLDVIPDDYSAQLWSLDPLLTILGKTKSITANDRTWMQFASIADDAILCDRNM